MSSHLLKPVALIADDDPSILTILTLCLKAQGFETVTAQDGQSTLAEADRHQPDLVLLDVEMPTLTGIDVLRRLRRDRPTLPIIIMTAHGTVALAVEAMKEGATEFLTKPFETDTLLMAIQRAMDREGLRRQVDALRSEVSDRFVTIETNNPTMRTVLATARKAAESDATMLLLGESGVGKDVLARSIHAWSPRREKMFAPVNCVALTEELLESELFGHEKGAFTGAHVQKLGKLEVAGGGTVFLDEIGDMKPGLQAKLLRFLQNREFDRVGGIRSIKVDVRIIAATNRDLQQAVKEGAFRADLFFRLNVVSLTIPPLRDRREDIPDLAGQFVAKHCRNMKRPLLHLSPDAITFLTRYTWPGNVRELENAIERAVVLKTGTTLEADDFALQPQSLETTPLSTPDLPFHESVEQHKVFIIRQALGKTGGSKSRAAQLLGLQPTYLSRLIKQLNI